MGLLFINCYSLKYLDLRSFDTSCVNYMDRMFENCYNLTSIELSSFKSEGFSVSVVE